MAVYDFPHKGREETARFMYWLAKTFKSDLGTLAGLSFPDFFDYVRAGPYASDDVAWGDPDREVVARPGFLLDWRDKIGLDCKKKAILIGAWAESNAVPWELIAMSEQPDKEIHHVFPLILSGNQWVISDATYPRYQLGAPKPEMTTAERLFR